jgi:hypothetical protein
VYVAPLWGVDAGPGWCLAGAVTIWAVGSSIESISVVCLSVCGARARLRERRT